MKTDAIIILDGYGLSANAKGNAVKNAETPYLDYLFRTYPHSTLSASGRDVGLPEGQMGNSEVGHLNIGAGRTVNQDIVTIDNAIENGSFFTNEAFLAATADPERDLHLCGLTSEGGVHSTLNHLFALLELAKRQKIKNVYIHCVLDGRDTPPQSALKYLDMVEEECARLGVGKIATVTGRYYTMDRDQNWDRVEKGYNCIFEGQGLLFKTATDAVKFWYANGKTDEFAEDCIIGGYEGFKDGSAFIFYNYRADRAKEITMAATDPNFSGFKRISGFLHPLYVGMTQYDKEFKGLLTAFPPKNVVNTLGRWLSAHNKTQARIAETEKYAHVTYFFNGGVKEPDKGETRVLIPSLKVTFDKNPEMSAAAVAAEAVKAIGTVDVLVLNFANCDMVGHTGVYGAAITAVETVDRCLKEVTEAVLKSGGTALILSDHGNAEMMSEADGTPMTAHTTNPVPFILVGENYKTAKLEDGTLRDVAPTFLQIIGLPAPKEMTGKNLINA